MRTAVPGLATLLLLLTLAVPSPCQVTGTDLAGQRITLAAPGRTRAVVLYFVASDCPISNREIPEMLRVRQQYAGQGVQFWFVYANATESAATVHAHQLAYRVGGGALSDPGGQLARLAGAKLTPEATVLLPEGRTLRPVYTGRIDDRFLSLGKERPQATEHDLEEAVMAVLAGKPPRPAGGPPTGCGIVSAP